MAKYHVILSENDIAKIINGEEITVKIHDEEIIVRQSYMKDFAKDMLIRKNRVMDTASNTFKY